MSNNAFLSMASVLENLGIYDTTKPQINAELCAYEVGFQLIFDEIENVLNNAFISTADMDSLNYRELLFRPVITELDIDVKRTMLLEREIPRGALVSDMNARLIGAGIEGTITENYLDGVYLDVVDLIGVSSDQAVYEAKSFLPVSLTVYMDFDDSL